MTVKQNNLLNTMRETLSARGVSFTQKRQAVMQCLLAIGRPVSAYELADQYAEDVGEKIPVMSVYRILDFLTQENFVHKLSSTNKYVACSHITCQHEHQVLQFLICSRCDSVSETAIDRALMESLKANVESTGFKMINQQLEIMGICQSCQLKM